ncbi:glycosyl transferase family 1 [Bacillus thuringiensis]|uniref:glycosyltransferase family 4 protein n=1 Tax=Bacillus thuringiensis TaxID=1428 RepID=UPI0008FDA8E1|nr:glycosyltransferase family 4 protein [Bacillus thuringiensis]OJE33654.1 glycosyl transferase family 1 [Bacillus thuringiensis]
MTKLLVLNHFPTIIPPNTGGVLRYYHIYNELSKFYDVTLISQKYTSEVEKVDFSNTFREFRIPNEAIQHEIDQQLIAEDIGPRFSTHAALSCALIKKPPISFLKYYNQFYENSDVIIHDSPFSLKYDINFDLDNKPRIYNSHNHESVFAKKVWFGKNVHQYVRYITRMEQYLVENARLVFATSEEDRKSFIDFFNLDKKKIKLAPNGIKHEEWYERKKHKNGDSRTTAFFIGSMHQPNIDIVKFIISHLAKKCKDIDFFIAGQCGSQFFNCILPNIKILGEVTEKHKLQLFSEVDIAINPAFFGTGTKIKTLEFLSAGIPLLSTDVGVKGMFLKHGEHYFHATHKDFASILNMISKDKHLLNKIASKGQSYINNNFSWKSIAQKIKEHVDTL